MIKTTLKEIKGTQAVDITAYDFEKMCSLIRNTNFENIAYSTGVYGVNGVLLRDSNAGTLYKVTARSTALFMVV